MTPLFDAIIFRTNATVTVAGRPEQAEVTVPPGFFKTVTQERYDQLANGGVVTPDEILRILEMNLALLPAQNKPPPPPDRTGP